MPATFWHSENTVIAGMARSYPARLSWQPGGVIVVPHRMLVKGNSCIFNALDKLSINLLLGLFFCFGIRSFEFEE